MSLWLDLLGAEVGSLTAGGVNTRYAKSGTGEPVLLLHGMGGHLETWSRNVVPLGQSFEVWAVDMVGHGLSDKPEKSYSIPDFVEHVLAFIDARTWNKVHLVGQSLGGWVACWLALWYPDRVASLVLVTSAGLQPDPRPPAEVAAHENLRKLTQLAAEEITREAVRRRLEWLVKDRSVLSEEMVELRWRLYQDPQAQKALKAMSDRLTGADMEEYALRPEQLARLPKRTLFLWTTDNPSTSWRTAQKAADLVSGSRFVLMGDCAHWPQYEKPDEFNRIVAEFLGKEA